MTAKHVSIMAIAALATVGYCLGATPVLAQAGNAPGMGCPDGAKDGGVVAMQPLPGGGCDNTVYKTDKDDSYAVMPGGKRGTTPVGATTPASADKKKKPDSKEPKATGKASRDGEKAVR